MTLTFGLIFWPRPSAPLISATKNGLPSEPTVMPIDFRSLAEAAPAASASAAPASSSFLNIDIFSLARVALPRRRASCLPVGIPRPRSWPARAGRRPVRCARRPAAGSGRARPRR